MREEMNALERNQTWKIVELPKEKKPVRCKWVYTLKYKADGSLESLQAPAEANETTQDIHQGERDSDSTSEKPIPIEAEPQETTERKKDAPQVLLQEPIAEATQGAGVGESEPRKATGIVDAQGFEHKAEGKLHKRKASGGDLTEERRVEGEKAKSDEEKEEEEEEEEEEGEEHKKTDSGSDAPVMVEASRDIVDVKVASKKHYNILSGVGSKVKNSISKVNERNSS
ncbi:hypothetical protein BDE02_04G112400 [Populus trichocarpa]|nr:hypothetical protein BDE02_04G112400 [Populus trichocarpa]